MFIERMALTAVWLNAGVNGAVSPDDVVHACGPVRIQAGKGFGLLLDHESLATLVAQWRQSGIDGVRLLLPVAGDPGALPGPPDLTRLAVDAKAGLVPWPTRTPVVVLGPTEDSALWSAHEMSGPLTAQADRPTCERELASAIRLGAEELEALDVAAGRERAERLLGGLKNDDTLVLPDGYEPRAAALLDRGLRLHRLLSVAGLDEGAAVSASASSARRSTLTQVATSVRRAVEAAAGEPWASR